MPNDPGLENVTRHLALPVAALTRTARHRAIVPPSWKNVTRPPRGLGLTVAVKVTRWPVTDRRADDVSDVLSVGGVPTNT